MSLAPTSLRSSLTRRGLTSLAVSRLRRKAETWKRTSPPRPLPAWENWARLWFAHLFTKPFGERHHELWQHIEAITPDGKPPAFFAVWPRKAGKSTNLEAAVIRLGAKRVRNFVLYVRSQQTRANETIQNIGSLLESDIVQRYDAALSSRKLSRYGYSKGWRMDMLRTESGLNVVGLGLDVAVRGLRLEEFRPDVIIFDDIDDKEDSPATITKKVGRITSAIIPAGSDNVAVIGAQNLVHIGSIFNKVVTNEADFLYNRIVSGPYPAVVDLETKERDEGGYTIIGGKATWAGQDLATCQEQINEWGLTTFKREAQHEVEEQDGGMYTDITFRHCEPGNVPDLERIVVWVDPAVTDTNQSDSQGINADGINHETIYRLWSWEERTTPNGALEIALLKALELGADTVGVETDQGGDLWKAAYDTVAEKWVALSWELYDNKAVEIDSQTTRRGAMFLADRYKADSFEDWKNGIIIPGFKSAKAGSVGSKTHRGSIMLSEYERGRFVHVRGTHRILERALRRFPLYKPFDLHDAAFWSMRDLLDGGSLPTWI